jgi:hypothetical protein
MKIEILSPCANEIEVVEHVLCSLSALAVARLLHVIKIQDATKYCHIMCNSTLPKASLDAASTDVCRENCEHLSKDPWRSQHLSGITVPGPSHTTSSTYGFFPDWWFGFKTNTLGHFWMSDLKRTNLADQDPVLAIVWFS